MSSRKYFINGKAIPSDYQPTGGWLHYPSKIQTTVLENHFAKQKCTPKACDLWNGNTLFQNIKPKRFKGIVDRLWIKFLMTE